MGRRERKEAVIARIPLQFDFSLFKDFCFPDVEFIVPCSAVGNSLLDSLGNSIRKCSIRREYQGPTGRNLAQKSIDFPVFPIHQRLDQVALLRRRERDTSGDDQPADADL